MPFLSSVSTPNFSTHVDQKLIQLIGIESNGNVSIQARFSGKKLRNEHRVYCEKCGGSKDIDADPSGSLSWEKFMIEVVYFAGRHKHAEAIATHKISISAVAVVPVPIGRKFRNEDES